MSPEEADPVHREIQELLGVYALDAVDAETAAVVERHLAECMRCSAEVDQHHEVAGLLANTGGPAPAGLWGGIASRLGGSDASGPPPWEELASRLESEPGPEPPPPDGHDAGAAIPIGSGKRRGRTAMRVAVVVAAAAAVVAVVLGVQVDHLNHRVDALRAPAPLSRAEQAAMASPTTRVVDLRAPPTAPASAPPVGKVTVVLTRSGTGFVEGGGLSSLPQTETYQLWGVIGSRTISLGLLGSTPRVVAFSVAGNKPVRAFAITAEHAGGVVQSTRQPVVAGAVTA